MAGTCEEYSFPFFASCEPLNGTVCISAFWQGHALLCGCLWKGDSQLRGTANVLTPRCKNIGSTLVHQCPFTHLGREEQVRVNYLAQGHQHATHTGFELKTLES